MGLQAPRGVHTEEPEKGDIRGVASVRKSQTLDAIISRHDRVIVNSNGYADCG